MTSAIYLLALLFSFQVVASPDPFVSEGNHTESEANTPAPSPSPSSSPEALPSLPTKKPKPKDTGSSVAPIVGYEPTYRFVAGGAYFYEGEDSGFGIDAYTNFRQVYQSHLRVNLALTRSWRIRLYLVGIRGFDAYYGEGGETDVNSLTQLWGSRSMNDFAFQYQLSEMVNLDWIWSFRTRNEESHLNPSWNRRFPDERTAGTGVAFQVDTTKKREPTDGFRFRAQILYLPGLLSTIPTARDLYQIGGSLIVYKEILDEVSKNIVAAFRVESGMSFGHPSYMYKYRLGGSDGISGYQDNRFRGNKYYAQLTEVRYPIWKLFSGALSLGFGDAADYDFTNPKLSYGFGFRIGLPPDWVSKIRIDFAWGRDQSGVFVNFGQNF